MAEENEKKSPRDILRIVFRRRRLFLLGASLFMIVALVAAHYMPVKYTGIAKFTRRVDPASEGLKTSQAESFETRKLMLQNDLAGYKAVEKVVEDLKLTRNLPRTPEGRLTLKSEQDKQEMVREMMKRIKVAWEVSSPNIDLIAVSCEHSDPDLARDVPNSLVHNYIAWVSDQIVQRLRDSEEFLKDQRARLQEQCNTANSEKIKFELENAGAMPASVGALDEQITRLTSEIDVLRRQRDLAETKLSRFMTMAAGVPPASSPATGAATEPASQPIQWVKGPNPEIDRLHNQLRDANEVLKAMTKVRGMREEHPEVKAQRRLIAQIEERLKETPAEIVKETVYGPIPGGPERVGRIDLSVEIAAAQSEKEITGNELQRLEARLTENQELQKNFGPVLLKYNELVKKLQDKEVELKGWDTRYTEIQMALAAESAKKRTQHESVLAAQEQVKPSSPSLLMVLGFALGGGLAFGAGLVFLSNVMDRSITTTEEAIKLLHAPVHGVIGEVITARQRTWRSFRKWIVTPIVSAAVGVTIAAAMLSVVLWLDRPDQFKEYRKAPVGFVVMQLWDLRPR